MATKKKEVKETGWFRKHYTCSECEEQWYDEWDCLCNDRCPNCDTEIEPDDHEMIPHPKGEDSCHD